MNTFTTWVLIVLLVGLLAVSLVGLFTESKEQNDLRNELELLNERLDRAGFPKRLPVHVVTTPPAAPVAEPDGPATDVLPVVGRHRIERREATDAAVVVVGD